MKRFSGNLLALIGLLLGIAAGMGIVFLKEYLIGEIVQALNEEVVASCPECTVDYDTFAISFLTLSGRATNVRILEKGTPKLSFPTVTATFSINEILSKKIYLETLVLSDGNADGVGPDSVTFRFIDQITKPLPPELQKKDRWRAILNTLELKSMQLRESFGTSELTGANVGLFVKRIDDTFVLLPDIGDLRYRSFLNDAKTEVNELPLGRVSGSVVIEEGKTLFNSLRVSDNSSVSELKGEADSARNDALSGTASYHLNTAYIGLPEWLLGTFDGQGELRGTLGSPIIAGKLANASDSPLTLAFPNASPISLSSMSCNLKVDLNHGDPIVTLSAMKGSGENSTLTGNQPLVFSDDGLTAGFDLTAPHFTYGPFSVSGAKASLSIKPHKGGTLTSIKANVADLLVQGTSLGPATLALDITPSAIDVSVDSNHKDLGELHWKGSILLDRAEPFLKDGILVLNNYRYPLAIPVDPNQLSPVRISAHIPLSGPVDLARLTGEGPTTVAFPSLRGGMPLSGRTTLKDGVLNVSLPTSAYKGALQLRVDVARTFTGKLNASLPKVPLSQFLNESDCGVVDASLDYTFPLSTPLGGSGSLTLGDVNVGCQPYVLHFPKNEVLTIANGALRFKSTKLTGGDTNLELNGSVGFTPGLDLSLSGDLHLSSLLPLLPSVDNLQGLLSTKVTLKGPLKSPSCVGSAQLKDGELALESPDLGAHSVEGKFSLAGDSVRIDHMTGSINGGSFTIDGTLLPFSPAESRLMAKLKEVTVEPMKDASITFSGDLTLGMNQQKHQSLSGNIAIDFAEISKDFDLNRILMQTIKGYFLPARVQPHVSSKPMAIDLDVAITAPRNIFVLTPFFSAELNTNIRAGGTTVDPALSGSMQLLSGWVGLKGNRFDVTTGSLTFKPGTLTPHLEISSEGVLRAPTGESVLVILSASGPLTAPRISVSSDRGISQEDLLLLITASRSLTGRTMANRVGLQFGEDRRFFLSTDSFSSFSAFFENLTKIDTLSFEPTFNQYTGLVEPAVVARKNLTSRLELVGNSLFSTVSNSKAGVVYSLTPSLDVNGFVQSVSTQQNIILSSDFTYTILSEQAELVDIKIEGLRKLDEEDILNAARIGRDSRLQPDPESLGMVRRDIVLALNDRGYLGNSVEVQCTHAVSYCKELLIKISEGPRYTIDSIVLEGGPLPPDVEHLAKHIVKQGDAAVGAVLSEVERQLVLTLRHEGYIAARVTPTFRKKEEESRVDLVINSDIREPIQFVFKGNTVFTADQFLASIDLFSRKRPFGNNTIKLLLQNIEQMYQANGYLFAQVTFTEDRSDLKRLTYIISIAEEAQTKVNSLTITGNNALSIRRIRELMKNSGLADAIELLSPKYAIPSQLDALKEILVALYQQEGYPDVRVEYSITPVKNEDTLDIVYTIEEGEALHINTITIRNYPSELNPPAKPASPTSLPRANEYVEQLIEALQDEGFLFPSINAEPGAGDNSLSIEVTPGPRSIITGVSIEGLSRIDESVARRYIALHVGEPYQLERVNETKRLLLRSGLFSRVEVVPTDGKLESAREALTVRLVERPLETLEVGTGANSEFGLHVFGEATDKSLFSDGRSLSTRVDTYFDQARINPSGSDTINQGFASLRYLDPFFMDSDYQLTEEVRFQRQELSSQEFNLDRVLFASYFFRQYSSGMTFTGGHSLALDKLLDVAPGAIITPLDEGHVRLSFLSATWKYDRRDDPLIPHRGYTLSLEPRLSMQQIGSEANFGALTARSTGVVPLDFLSPRFSLGLGLTGGIGWWWDGTEEIPITQRFYTGGRTTVRGYKENSLGPEGEDGAVIGGDTLLNQRNQFQYLVLDSLSTHLFMDFGTVWLRDESFRISEMRTGTGVGFQYISPIGPIGFDLGHPLDRKPGEDNFLVHFSVGSPF